jgi:hypothetical protein
MRNERASRRGRQSRPFALCAILVALPLLAGCFDSGLTHEELKGPDPLPVVGIFRVHAWWHPDERVNIRWYVLNAGEETWEPFLFGGTAVSSVVFEPLGPLDEGYREVQYVPRQFHDPPVPPRTAVAFQYTFEHPSDPSSHHLASVSAGWSGGGEFERTYCLAKAPPLDVRACALRHGAHPNIDKDERLLWPRLRDETGWLPPPVDVPEASCRLEAANVRCDYSMWNWDNASSTVDAEVTIRLVTDARLEAVFRTWRTDLPASVSKTTFEVPLAA